MKSFKPMSTTKMALIENMLKKMSDFLKDLEEMEKMNAGDENVVSMLKASVDVFSESINDFKGLEVNEKLFSIGATFAEIRSCFYEASEKNLKKEVTPEIRDLMKKTV